MSLILNSIILRVSLLLLLTSSTIHLLLWHLGDLTLGTPDELGSIRYSHRVHHKLDVTRVHSLRDLIVFGAKQHILRGGAVQVDVHCAAHHVLHRVRIGMDLLRIGVKQFVALFVF